MIWGYYKKTETSQYTTLHLPLESYPHALVTGSSGSGRSYALLYLLGMLLQESDDIEVYILDFKNSEDFEFLSGYKHYFKGDECYEGVMEYYEKFAERRRKRNSKKRMLLLYDEFPSSLNYFGGIDKRDKTKKATDISNAVAEILMLGRGINCGVWIVTQRADASLFANGSRDSFMVFLGLGRMSKEQKGMIFAGEEVPNRVYQRGEGCILADGYPLYEVKIPVIGDIVDWKKHIKQSLGVQ